MNKLAKAFCCGSNPTFHLTHFPAILRFVVLTIDSASVCTKDSFSSFQIVPTTMTIASNKFNDYIWLRRGAALIVILLIGLSNVTDMVN